MSLQIPVVAVLALFVAVSCDQSLPTAAPDEAEITEANFKVIQNDKVPFTWTEWNACTNEFMDTAGRMHFVVHETYDQAGGLHTKFHMQPMRMKAVGRTTGMVCQGNGPTEETFRFGPGEELPFQYTYRQQYMWICPGPGNNATAHSEWRVRVNANGEITVWVENARSECLPR